MHRCPQCGYKDRPDWPLVLWVIAFFALYLVWMLGEYQPRDLRWDRARSVLLFTVGGLRLAFRYPARPTMLRSKPTGPRESEDEEKS